jgi:sensor histidine kinase regulating citrate/malate metabolism
MLFRKTTLWGLASLLSLTLPAAAVIIWHPSWWPLIVFVVWTFAVCAIIVALQRLKHREQCDRLLTHSQVSAIRTLSHHRHDWMNELQILYGYLRLNKLERAVDVVDRIRGRMEQDSRVSQIGIPELATFLLSFRTVCDTMRLDLEIQDGLHLERLPYRADMLSRTITGLVNVIRFRAVSPLSGENVLKLVLSQSEGALKIVMAYQGELAAADSVSAEIKKCLEGIGQLDDEEEPTEQSEIARTMVIHFPLTA